MTDFIKIIMEASSTDVSLSETEILDQNEVAKVLQNVYNLSNQQVGATGVSCERQMVEMAKEEKEDLGQPSVELQTGFRILKDLMADSNKNVNWPFMEPIEVSAPTLVADYHKKIEKPVWLKLMKEKFEKHEYISITEFVSDFRLMLENCYRYNGPDHYVSKRGQKLETMLEQKLALLSRDLRAKTTIAATSGHLEEDNSASAIGLRRRQRAIPRHDSTLLLNQLREEELQRERNYRRQVLMDRKAEKEALALEIIDWEDKILFQGKYKEQMTCMWELPQIGLFLFLCQVPLNIGEIMQLELERCIMVPRESSTMHLIMTSLLSTPFQRQRIDKKTLMPYKVWNEKLRTKLQQWYKIYTDSGCDAEKACVKLGFEPDFFRIVGQKNPMEKRKFHEISFYRRVWIVKGLVDYCMQTQDYLRETVETQPYHDQREYMLGTDGDGWRYLHFPQFCGADVRIYRQAPIKYPKIEIKPDPFDSKRKFPLKYKPPPAKKAKVVKKKKKEKKHTPPVSPVTRLRPAGLRQTPKTVIPLQLIDSSSSSTSEDESESQEGENVTDTNEEAHELTADVNEDDKDVNDESDTDPAVSEDEKTSVEGRSSGSDATIPYCDNSDSVCSCRTCSRASSPCFTQESISQDTRDSVSQDTRFADSSRENSPMIDDHMLRKLHKGPRLKELPNSRAARNLNSFLFMEDSNSKNSDFGDNSNLGIPSFKGRLDLKDILLNENSSSSSLGDNSPSCDMGELFKNSSVNLENVDDATKESEHHDVKGRIDLEENMDTSENEISKIQESEKKAECSEIENTASEPQMLSETVEKLEETEMKTEQDHVPSEAENKENIEICNMSHEQLILKNANGFINRTESLVQDEKEMHEKSEEEIKQTCKFLNSENIENIEMSEEVDKNADLKLDVSSEGLKMAENYTRDTDMEMDSQKSESENSESNMVKQNNLTSDTCDLESLNENKTKEKGDSNSIIEMAVDTVSQNLIDNEESLFTNPNNTAASHTLNPQKTVHVDIKTETKGAFDVLGGHIIDSNMCDVNGQSNDSESQGSEQFYLDKIKTEIKEENHEDCLHEGGVKETIMKEEKAHANEVSFETVRIKSETNGIKTEPEEEKHAASDLKNETNELERETNEVKCELDKVKNEVLEVKSNIKEEVTVKEEQEDETEEEEVTPDMETFKLIVDSVEGLRELTKQFEEPEPIIIKRGKKEQITKPPPRKRSVVLLHSRLSYLLKELEPWEAKLNQATKRARIKLRKEVEDYVEKEEEEQNAWDTDEETESGSEASGNENEADKHSKASSSPTKSLKGRNSECSTPVKFEENSEDFDISQRGRLRKRRIIPNNIEDQNPVKKSKVSRSDSSHQPLVQKPAESSGKITIGYSELIRQLKAASPAGLQGTNSPILLQTSQGGKLLVTSIVPTGPKRNTNVQNLVPNPNTNVQNLVPNPNTNVQNLVPNPKSSQTFAQQVLMTMAPTVAQTTVKQSQHPTIQHLLAKPQSSDGASAKTASALLAASSGLRHILPQTTAVIQGVTTSVIMRPVTSAGNQQTTPIKMPIILKPNTTITPQKLVVSYSLSSQKIPPGMAANSYPVISQQVPVPTFTVVTTSPSVSVSPRLVPVSAVSPQTAESDATTASKGKVKYYAANASSLPINVVHQLLATRGAKLQTGPNEQSILFIPMESEGGSRSVVPVTKVTAQSSVTLTSTSPKPEPQISETSVVTVAQVRGKHVGNSSAVSSTSVLVPSVNVSIGSQSVNNSTKVVISTPAANTDSLSASANLSLSLSSSGATNSNASVLLPSDNTAIVSPTSKLATSVPVTQLLQIQTEPAIIGSNVLLKSSDLLSGSVGTGVIKGMYSSPPKYPTNETVRTLLFKRKSSAEEKEKSSLPSPDSSVEKTLSEQKSLHGIHFQKISPKPPTLATITVANPIALQQLPIQQIPFQQISPNQSVILAPTTTSSLLTRPLTVVHPITVSPVSLTNTQQCVYTTISASKLNTLLLQTNAAGAKSIPSLIKLPSKAALDSAVKAVVTSVNITLPTVNIKVPSPTSLPSIGPRRNVTKTIQTMKSPIPVAPKVVTQSSGSAAGTALSIANSNMLVTSSPLPLVSVPGQPGGLVNMTNLSNLISTQQIQSQALPVVSLAGQPVTIGSNLLQAVRAQLGSTASVSVAGQTIVTSAPIVSPGQSSLQTANLLNLGQSAAGVVQNIDGKNVLTKMIPQTILTSQGLLQGFITPQGIVIPQAKKIQTGSQVISQTGTQSTFKTVSQTVLKQESGIVKQPGVIVSTVSQLKTTPSSVSRVLNFTSTTATLTRPIPTPATVQYIKAVQPLASGSTEETQARSNSAPLLTPVSQLKSPALSSVTLPETPALSSAVLKSPQGQTSKFIFPPDVSASSFMNNPSSLLVPGSVNLPIASPLLNQLGLPILQSGMAVQSPGVLPQSLNLLQSSLNPSALQQLVNPVLLAPGVVSPQLLNQSQGLQLSNHNLQAVQINQPHQNNVIQLSSQVAAQTPKVFTGKSETVSQPGSQVQLLGNTPGISQPGSQIHLLGNTPGISSEVLKQINAAALVKQLASSQLQTKVNVVTSSTPEVKPVLLQQQLNTPTSLPGVVKIATPNMVQNLVVPKQAAMLKSLKGENGPSQVISGHTLISPQAASVLNSQQVPSDPLVPQQFATGALKAQTGVPLVSQLGQKTIAVNQITHKVVTPVCTQPTPVKGTQVPTRVIAVNKRSNKLEEVFQENLTSGATATSVGQGQSKPVIVKPLKSPEMVQTSAAGSQQKIMLFSIGGQLVTQQGVPVTLENGVLKLMKLNPQAIVQIANQTLTPKQIQQTLAKISQATFPSVSVNQQGNSSQNIVKASEVALTHLPASVNVKAETSPPAPVTTFAVKASEVALQHFPDSVKDETSPSALETTFAASSAEALSRDHTYETHVKTEVKTSRKSSESILQPVKKRSGARISLDEQLKEQMVTVPNITSTGSNNVQFVLKPMVTSGYIVCPRITSTSTQSTNTKPKSSHIQPEVTDQALPESETKANSSSGAAVNLQIKTEKGSNINGERGNENNGYSDDNNDDDDESQLVIDTNEIESNKSETSNYSNTDACKETNFSHESFVDKEAALNLLRLANQALGSSDEAEEKYIDNTGDATSRLGR